jgi:O-antigen/teichoic acid export membrane protein
MIVLKEKISKIFFASIDYQNIIYITSIATLVTATNNIISAPTRMQNRRKTYLIINTMSSFLSYSIAIPLLLSGHYLIALPLATTISGCIIEMSFAFLNRKWFSIKRFDKKILKQLLRIAIPLFPNFLIYWIYNSFDKVMITNMLGIGESGIYAVAAKIGTISQLIYTAFAGGWQYFAFSTMKEENQVKSNSLIFEYLGVISYFATILMCTFSHLIFKILFNEEYIRAYIIAPYLFMAPLLQMLFQVACNQFLVIKKTWPNLFILIVGAIINVILNFVLIPVIGIEGAAISTLIGYAVSNIIIVIVLKRMKLMIISKRMVISVVIAFIYIVFWRLFLNNNIAINLIVVILIMISYILFYKREILILFNNIRKREYNNEQ